MKSKVLNSTVNEVKHWWTSMFSGLLIVVLGVWSFFTSDKSLINLATLFTITFIMWGLFEILFSIRNKQVFSDWVWTLAGGIIDVGFGIFMIILTRPELQANLLIILGIWLVLHSIAIIFQALDMKKIGLTDSNWPLWISIATSLCALVFVFSNMLFGRFIVPLAAITLLIMGLFKANVSLKLKSFNEEKQMSQNTYGR